MNKKLMTIAALSAGLLGGLASSQTASAKTKHYSAMPKAYRHTWSNGKDKVRITAHTVSYANVGHKFNYVSKFSKVQSYKVSGHWVYQPMLKQGYVMPFTIAKGRLYIKSQVQSPAWSKPYHH